MPFEDDFVDLMNDTVTVEPWTGQDAYAKPSFGAAVQYKGRVVSRIRMVRAFDGQEKVSSRTVWLAGDLKVDPRDRLTLPDGTQPPILSVNAFPDETGPHHRMVFTQ